MEELTLDFSLDELELIEKRLNTFSFPVAHFGKGVYFNIPSLAVLGGVKYVRWYATTEYVICLPTSESDPLAFSLCTAHNSAGLLGRFPAMLAHDKKLKPGNYRLLKYKNGVAFKRYEQLSVK